MGLTASANTNAYTQDDWNNGGFSSGLVHALDGQGRIGDTFYGGLLTTLFDIDQDMIQ